MDKYQNLPFHPTMEKVVNILRKKTQNDDPEFFRLVVSYFFSKIASMMRTHVALSDEQKVPVNMYAINLAPSGSGKGHSINIIEEEILAGFRTRFLEDTFPSVAEKRIAQIAVRRAQRDQTDPNEEKERAMLEFEEQGVLLFSFDSGTSAAIKQMRTKLLMAGAGSMNLEMDEIGSNITGNTEVLNNYLELFDAGRIKQKLVKNTRDNIRSEDLFGATPTNMLLFGTPVKLLDGGKTEEEFITMQEIGYARRCFYGFSRYRKTRPNQTAADMYKLYHDPKTTKFLMQLNDKLAMLADPVSFNQVLEMKQDVLMALYEYRIACQNYADNLSEFHELQKSEISHRYFKVAKLAAVYAYIDGATYIGMHHLEYAIAMAEASGQAFLGILNRDKTYVKLANYICSIDKELTQADLVEDLPFYRGSEQSKREMMNLAIAHGYKNGMYIRTELQDGIQFFSGKKVPETRLDQMTFSFSKQFTEGYKNQIAPFKKLHQMTNSTGYHWVTHHLRKGYRSDEHVIPGVNMIVLDVEKSIDIPTAKLLLKDYTWLLHTTKRHTDKAHRYRIIMPLSHTVELDRKEFRGFMQNIFSWLPFDVDAQTTDRARKWLTFKGKYWYNDAELLDALQFVPKTKKADERKQVLSTQTNLSNLERWFVNNSEQGNRNNQLRNYAFMLIDMGYDLDVIRSKVHDLNEKFNDSLEEAEVNNTIMVTVTRRIAEGVTNEQERE